MRNVRDGSETGKLHVSSTYTYTGDLLLIQQNKYYWISNRSGVAELICTVT